MLEAHPFADLFPMLDAADSDALRDDIAQHGLRDKIVLYHDRILDGRNRYRALMEIAKLGLLYCGEQLTAANIEQGEFFTWFTGSEAEALEFVLSKNLHRRHLTESQRAMVAANLATMKPGRPDADNGANLPHFRLLDAAERLHVSERSIKDARVVKDRGVDDLNDAVQRGDLKVSVAAQLARLTPQEQREVLAQHADRRALSGIAKDLRAERQKAKAERRIEREQALGAKEQALPNRRYGVIIADPEWKYLAWSAETGSDRSPDNHYPCSDLDDIKARPVGDIAADDCALFLWVTTPFLDAGFEVMKAWGFDYKSSIVWGKERVGEARGTAYWFRGEHETVLFGTHGNVPAPIPGTQFPSFFLAPVGEHSAKPDKIHEIAEAYFPNLPKIELNARRKRAGWDGWGNEADGGEDELSGYAKNTAGLGRTRADAPDVGESPAARASESAPFDARLADVEIAVPQAKGAQLDSTGKVSMDGGRSDGRLTDEQIIRTLTCEVADQLGLVPTEGFEACLAKAEQRRLRHAVIFAASSEPYRLSTARIGAVLGIKKQSVHEQLQAARAEASSKIAEAAQ